jgi:ribosomal protein S12 methylthiotransferase accessory factor
MPQPFALSSSLRAVSPETTLARARRLAHRLGVTRVTDTTRLDRVGLPVFASVRPGAAPGSLCVNAGKGLRPIEAEVGATMEAIEMALAEPDRARSRLRVVRATARDVLDGRSRPEAILDLCPKLGKRVTLDEPLDCVAAHDVATGERALVPAELVFVPYSPRPGTRSLFGSSSNGLASGNTLREATVHGLAEVIERDVTSFEAVRDTSSLVDLDTVDGEARAIVDVVRASGLELYVRAAPNVFGLPYFFAIINDPDALAPHLLNGGFGCHPHRSVAFVRAVAEAAQSRLSYIHGARDDLVDVHDRCVRWSREKKRAFVARVVGRAASGRKVAYGETSDRSEGALTLARAESFLLARLRACGMPRALRVVFTRPGEDLQVVKVIVPGLEMFSDTIRRVGPRLRDHVRKARVS